MVGSLAGWVLPARGAPVFASGWQPGDMVVADFNGDGKADLFLLDSRSPALYRGSGDGRLLTSERYAAASDPVRLVLGDYTGDRRADAFVVSRSGLLSFFLNISP